MTKVYTTPNFQLPTSNPKLGLAPQPLGVGPWELGVAVDFSPHRESIDETRLHDSLQCLLAWTLTALTPEFVHAGQARPPAPAAQSLPTGVERITSVEGITEYRLANGLQVLLFPDQSKQTITVNVTYKVGSRHEGYGETGMAHLLEHLVFKGSPRHRNIPQELTEHGSRPNGSTWFDRTNYFETFAATDENLRWALDLESDRMVNSFIAKADLDSEMTVVRNELESGENSPTNVLLRAGALDRVSLAQLRQVDDRLTLRSRERADRSTPGVLPHLLSAGQRGAARRRASSTSRRRSSSSRSTSARFRSPLGRSPASTRPSRRRTASALSPSVALATCSG